MSRPARLRDVAAAADVSLGTVSNVLNAPQRVRSATREHVYEAMRRLGYTRRGISFATTPETAPHPVRKHKHAPLLVSVGYLSVDIVTSVPVVPHRGDRMTADRITKHLGGPAAGVAVAAAALGPPFELDVELATAIGDDDDSRWALDLLAQRGVRTNVVRNPSMNRLSRCIVIVEADGNRTCINEPLNLTGAELLPSLPTNPASRRRHLHVEGYQARAVLPLVDELHAADWTVSLHDTGLPEELLSADGFDRVLGAFDMVILNRRTASRLIRCGTLSTRQLIEGVQRRLHASEHQGEVAMTLGVEGAVVFPAEAGASPVEVPAMPVEIVDGTGAGDCFTGAYLAQRLHAAPIEISARRACVTASLVMTSEGAQGRRTSAEEIAFGALAETG